MKIDNFRKDKGVAGLTILLSLVTMLFVIGLLVMIFTLMGGELKGVDSVIAGESDTVTQTNVVLATGVPTNLTTCLAQNEGVLSTLVSASNSSGSGEAGIVLSGNFTSYDNCTMVADAGTIYDNVTLANVTYTYTYPGVSYDVINDTTSSISNVTDWYDIFIVIGAMVVLILLTVIIITAIRGSGLMAGGGSTSGGTSGSA